MNRDYTAVKSDSGYHFAIVISVITVDSGEKEQAETSYYHSKFLMTVESKVRSLLVQLDSILNPYKVSQKL